MSEFARDVRTGQPATDADPGTGITPSGQGGATAGSEAAPGGPDARGPEAAGPDAAELEDRWRRALADLDNVRKRYAREVGRERTAERELVTAAFLPVLDTLDRAVEHADADPRSIVEGIRTLREQALAVVSGLGFRREDEPGVPFDPARHEVVGVVDAGSSGVAPGAVAAVVRPGYGTTDHPLRPAAVTVAQRSDS
jgi:molecular chaperone GrpE